MVRSRLVAASLVVTLATFGCATRPNPIVCGIAGQIAGAAGGVVIGGQSGSSEDSVAPEVLGGVVGALVGTLAGYYLCRQPEEPEPAERIVLRGVNFAFDSADIRPEDAVILDEAASILNRRQDVRVRVEGYTDSTGPVPYNQLLSERRARSVRDYLVGQGVAAERLTTEGFGELNPIASNDTREGRALNRRVELKVGEPE